jgi:hypothetical protein
MGPTVWAVLGSALLVLGLLLVGWYTFVVYPAEENGCADGGSCTNAAPPYQAPVVVIGMLFALLGAAFVVMAALVQLARRDAARRQPP